ncbi:MAG: Rieske (2Fe-2S) protein [Alphaproteobacteria bacterium]|jgi:nitrite reductase/ring-hydroxylating ferredoxin subunit|nr:Rieske (2Fe-2S) protein [Alphaproteobacteria bacterium]MBT4019626.1 Rieske (2Fe-2S) protein [Alphaproteobacteria bacterium]MBT4967105.1 Rieske (2Fe-2S) protein [Alphaproteobacteria bacterium]MBT5161777.1 Rieske (2Fe-2S) protein [Alphaproteobacteria bacterium]
MTSQSNWIPVSGSGDLAAASARAVVLPDHDVVIWRTKTGAVHAWENRCPHRGMRMSFGQVRDEKLVCRYHGWGFDEEGQCQNIPASPNAAAPPTACIKTWSCTEKDNLIWVDVSDESAGEGSAMSGDSDGVSSLMFCKSVYTDGDLDKVLALVGSARFLPLGYDGDGRDLDWSMTDLPDLVGDAIQILVSGAGSDQIVITGHQARDGRCGLHIMTPSTGDHDLDRQRRLHYSKWAKRLRWSLSNPDAAQDGFSVFS